MSNEQPTCVITGGAGFIGSHLAELLAGSGCPVRIIDNFCVGRKSNLASFSHLSNVSVVTIDIGNGDGLQEHFVGADWVFHLAALADIVPSIEAPEAYHRTNVDGTFNVLEASRKAGVKRFIYAASSSCYGIPDIYPTPENAPIHPMYPYALTKWIGERYVMHWCQTYKMPALALRMFNVYGPRARTSGTYGAVFGVFLKQKLAHQPLTIVGDGNQTRDFTYVSDVAKAFLMAARSEISGISLNVGSGGHYSVNQLAKLIGGATTHIPKRPGEPDCTFADTRLISRHFGWRPEVSFEEGVRRVLNCIDDWRDAPLWTPDSINKATAGWFKYLDNSALPPRQEQHDDD